jgi:hypothetical protein
MENSGRLSEMMTKLTDFLEGQEWYTQLKAKWEELDPQSRMYLQIAGAVSVVLLVLLLMLSAVWSVHSARKELSDKNDLLTLINSANDELKRLQAGAIPQQIPATQETGPWQVYFEGIASQAGLDPKTNLTVGTEKPGNNTEVAKESLYDLALKHVSIRNVVRVVFSLDSGSRPVKIRNLSIDTKADPDGYMDATLSVSAFTLIPQK